MRWSSMFAAGLLASGTVLLLQPAAYPASRRDTSKGWTAQVALDNGGPAGVSPPSFQALRAKLAPDDPLAVLEAIGYALAEVGDGATYVWRRTDGPLMGNVRMTGSFRSPEGAVCRRLTVTLVVGNDARPADATACRDADGRWQLGG